MLAQENKAGLYALMQRHVSRRRGKGSELLSWIFQSTQVNENAFLPAAMVPKLHRFHTRPSAVYPEWHSIQLTIEAKSNWRVQTGASFKRAETDANFKISIMMSRNILQSTRFAGDLHPVQASTNAIIDGLFV